MTESIGMSGKGIETIKKPEAVARTVPADARTSSASLTASEENVQTKLAQTTSATTSTAPIESPQYIRPSLNMNGDKKRKSLVPTFHHETSGQVNNIAPSSSTSSSKVEVKEAPMIQTKSQSKDDMRTSFPASKLSTLQNLVGGESDGGNDRVTVDKKPNKPLTPQSRTGSSCHKPEQSKVDKKSVSCRKIMDSSINKKIESKPPAVAKITQQSTIPATSLSNPVVKKRDPASIPSSSNPIQRSHVTSTPNSDMDESMNSVGDDEVQRQRAPLTEKYGPYISHSDTSLGDARRRLQIALDQTRQLRAAFTERVYGKYRVCLQPPPQTHNIIKALKDDPIGMNRKLELELKRITDEKNTEKRESQKISSSEVTALAPSSASSIPANVPPSPNATTAAPVGAPNINSTTSATSNADNAEQNLYVTSGLSLIVLPEDDVSDINMSMYRDRAPINPKTNQRVRGISAAAATSGKLMLDRARQGKIARADREKGLSHKLSQQAHNFFDSNYFPKSSPFNAIGTAAPNTAKQSSTAVARNPASTTQKSKTKVPPPRSRGPQRAGDGRKSAGAKRSVTQKNVAKIPAGQTAAGAKAIRARVQTPMTVQTLLNLNPIHEELRTDSKYSAATLAMMERGVGTFQGPTTQYHKNTPHRFKHPFPDSLGGRRRPVTSAGGIVDPSNARKLQLILPPVPSVRECRRHKKISVLSRTEAGTSRANLSIRKILDQFTPSANKSAVAIESIPTYENPLLGRPKKHRKISEIGFVRGLYLDSLEEGRARVDVTATNASKGAESVNSDNVGIDSTLTLNVLKAVGLIKSCVSNDSKSEKTSFQSSLASSLFKEIRSTDTGPYSHSISKLKDLEKKLSTPKRSFTAGFYSGTVKPDIERSVLQETEEKNHDQIVETLPKVSAPLSLRGGGSGSTNDGKESQNQTMNAAATQANLMRQNLIREERLQQQRIASLQAQGVAQHSAQLQAQLQSADHYRQTNALQLAHQLRLSRLQAHGHPGAGDLTDYIGGLHHSPQAQVAYGWSQASAAAAVANSNNLAALGLNPTGVTPLTVENRTRVLLAREQQNLAACVAAAQRQQAVALMRGMAVVDTPFAQAGYPRIPGQLLNPTAAALIARQGIQNRAIATNSNKPIATSSNMAVSTNSNMAVATNSKKAILDHKTVCQKSKPDPKNLKKNTAVERDALKSQTSKKNEKNVQHDPIKVNQNRTNRTIKGRCKTQINGK